MSGRLGAASVIAIGLAAMAQSAPAETINLQCIIGTGGPPVIVHLDLDALTAQMIYGKYPTIDNQKYQIEATEPDVRWDIVWSMSRSTFTYSQTLNVIKEISYGEYGAPYNYTWPCTKMPPKS